MTPKTQLAVDIGFTKFSGLSPKDALKLTRKWTVGKKVSRLKKLVVKSQHANREQIVELLDKIPEESLRNVIAHCYMRFGDDKVIFLHRNNEGALIKEEMTSETLRQRLRAAATAAESLSKHLKNTDEDAEQHFRAR